MILRIVGVLIAVLYVALGLALLLAPFDLFLGIMQRRMLAAVLIIYGCFRIFRYLRPRRRDEDDDSDSEIIDR